MDNSATPRRVFDLDQLFAAWEHVQANAGCAGSDGITMDHFAHGLESRLSHLLGRIQSAQYRPFPLLKIVVEKKPGSPDTRNLLVPTIADRILQTATARMLSRSFEEEFLECSYGYRPHKSVDRAIARIRKCHELGFAQVVDADIEHYFDNIDHTLLLERLASQCEDPLILSLIRQWVKGCFWDGQRLHALLRGIPQGSPISPLLANFFLEDFDRELEKAGMKLIRYADDFIILTRTPDDANRALLKTESLLSAEHLALNTRKTRVTTFEQGFHFLGALFKDNGIWIPWGHDHRKGKLLFMAPPLPSRLQSRFNLAPPRSEMEEALLKSSLQVATKQSNPFKEHDMAYLYLTEQGSILRKAGDRFLVERDDEVLLDLPYHKLDTVLVFGNIQITTQAMAELLDKGVTLSLFSRQGRFRGTLAPPRGGHVVRRISQFERFRDATASLALARSIVAAKLFNSYSTLQSYRAHSDPGGDFPQLCDALIAAERAATLALTVAALDGVEGSAAHAYFSALMQFNHSELPWPGRKKHPAPDPINALLSLTYTLLVNELTALLEGSGLDPYLGFLHQPDYGRASLAQDLIEPFRSPVADRFVLTIVNREQFQADDFDAAPNNGGMYLRPKALKRFLAEYEKWMLREAASHLGPHPIRDILKAEVERLVTALDTHTDFEPFRDHPQPTSGPSEEAPKGEPTECNTSSPTTSPTSGGAAT